MPAMSRRTFVLAVSVVGALAARTPEASQSASRFVLASASDKDGDPIAGLTADDFVVQDGGARCETLNASPAQYPVAILVDTSQAARPDFQQIKTAVAHLVDRLSGRDVALFSFGERAMKVVDFTRDAGKVRRAADGLFAQPEGESHVLDAIIESAKSLQKREPPIALILVLSAGSNDQSSRTPREVFEAVLPSRSMVQVVEMRTPQASGRLSNARGRRTSTSDRRAEAALGLEELLRGLADRTRGRYDLIYSPSGFHALLDDLQRRLASEVFLEYLAPANGAAAGGLQLGARLPGATVRGIGLDRAPR
jgi:von Willebrand factor type A domain